MRWIRRRCAALMSSSLAPSARPTRPAPRPASCRRRARRRLAGRAPVGAERPVQSTVSRILSEFGIGRTVEMQFGNSASLRPSSVDPRAARQHGTADVAGAMIGPRLQEGGADLGARPPLPGALKPPDGRLRTVRAISAVITTPDRPNSSGSQGTRNDPEDQHAADADDAQHDQDRPQTPGERDGFAREPEDADRQAASATRARRRTGMAHCRAGAATVWRRKGRRWRAGRRRRRLLELSAPGARAGAAASARRCGCAPRGRAKTWPPCRRRRSRASVARRGIGRRHHRRASRIADRAWRQAGHVGVVGRGRLEVGAASARGRAALAARQAVDHRRIALELHPAAQPIQEHRRHPRPLGATAVSFSTIEARITASRRCASGRSARGCATARPASRPIAFFMRAAGRRAVVARSRGRFPAGARLPGRAGARPSAPRSCALLDDLRRVVPSGTVRRRHDLARLQAARAAPDRRMRRELIFAGLERLGTVDRPGDAERRHDVWRLARRTWAMVGRSRAGATITMDRLSSGPAAVSSVWPSTARRHHGTNRAMTSNSAEPVEHQHASAVRRSAGPSHDAGVGAAEAERVSDSA